MATELETCLGNPSFSLINNLDSERDICMVHMVTGGIDTATMAGELAEQYGREYPNCSRVIQYIDGASVSQKITMIIIGK